MDNDKQIREDTIKECIEYLRTALRIKGIIECGTSLTDEQINIESGICKAMDILGDLLE